MKKTEKKKLPNHLQYDTVSPATKLLEKRRKMYEVHEAFEAQKEEFKKYNQSPTKIGRSIQEIRRNN